MLTHQKTSSSRPSSPTPFDFSDTTNFATTGKVACLLCQRQFKSEDQLKKHTDISELHKARLFLFDHYLESHDLYRGFKETGNHTDAIAIPFYISHHAYVYGTTIILEFALLKKRDIF